MADKIYAVADAVVSLVPGPLRGILSTARVANVVFAIVGKNPYPHVIEWMLTHPAELTELFVKAVWQAASGRGS